MRLFLGWRLDISRRLQGFVMKKLLSRSCAISTRVLAIVFLLILVAMQTVKFAMPAVPASIVENQEPNA
jgi:hypothetical protein